MAKILALYLPQYHTFKENDEWWGDGYTEWVAVKRATSLFKGHDEPRIPLNNNYYDLSETTGETLKWQAELAQKYGVDGFCIYNYWFKGHQLMEKPMEILLKHPEIQINYCICWANETWTRTWYGLEKEILIEQTYGNREDWIRHYEYLRRFFCDPRYIKVDNKPMLCIYHTNDISDLKEMRQCWEQLAQKDGFDGIYIVSGNSNAYILEKRDNLVDAYYNFEPGYTLKHKMTQLETLNYSFKVFFNQTFNKFRKKKILERALDTKKTYKQQFRRIETTDKKVYPGTFPQWDNTPRRSYKGLVYKNSSPELFKKNLIEIFKTINHDDFVFINAWNEWGEGAYLEPDVTNGYKFLEAIKQARAECEEELQGNGKEN